VLQVERFSSSITAFYSPGHSDRARVLCRTRVSRRRETSLQQAFGVSGEMGELD
jgi:hypothetical protein